MPPGEDLMQPRVQHQNPVVRQGAAQFLKALGWIHPGKPRLGTLPAWGPDLLPPLLDFFVGPTARGQLSPEQLLENTSGVRPQGQRGRVVGAEYLIAGVDMNQTVGIQLE